MKTKLTPQFNDGMPREVAISIFTEPKAKISNAFRKTCKRALETHYVAPPAQPKAGGDLLAKLHPKTLAQLLKWATRCKARRVVAQREYEKLVSLENPTRYQKARVAALSVQVAALDTMRDNIDDELKIRVRTITRIASAQADANFPPFGRHNRARKEQIRLDTQRGN